MYWEEKTKYIGEIIENRKEVIIFKANDNIPKILSINPSCGCTMPIYNKSEKELVVKFKAGEIPKHLNSDSYITSKKINIYYDNGNMDQLLFKCTIIKK